MAANDSNVKPYRLKEGVYTRFEEREGSSSPVRVTYQAGDTVYLTDERASRFVAGQLEPLFVVEATGTDSDDGSDDTEDTEDAEGANTLPWSDLLNRTVPEIVQSLQSITSTAELQAIADAERQGSMRISVAKAVERRLEELQPRD